MENNLPDNLIFVSYDETPNYSDDVYRHWEDQAFTDWVQAAKHGRRLYNHALDAEVEDGSAVEAQLSGICVGGWNAAIRAMSLALGVNWFTVEILLESYIEYDETKPIADFLGKLEEAKAINANFEVWLATEQNTD